MTAVIETPYVEPIPGMMEKALRQTRMAIRRKERSGIDLADLDALTVEDVYSVSPASVLLLSPPKGQDMATWYEYGKKVDSKLDIKGMNQWANNIIQLVQERKYPARRYV